MAKLCANSHERIADIVSVADKNHILSSLASAVLMKREGESKGLAGMEYVREGVYDGNRRVPGKLLNCIVRKCSGNKQVNPPFQVPGYIFDSFSFSDSHHGGLEIDRMAAQFMNRHFEGYPSAQRWLLENEDTSFTLKALVLGSGPSGLELSSQAEDITNLLDFEVEKANEIFFL